MIGKFVGELGIIPRSYGMAYRDFNRDGAMYYPIPLNWLVRWGLAVWLRLRFPEALNWHEARVTEAYSHGYERGLLVGRDALAREIGAEIARRTT